MRNTVRLAAAASFLAVLAAAALPQSRADDAPKVPLALKLEKDAKAEFVQTYTSATDSTSAAGAWKQSTETHRAWTATVASEGDAGVTLDVKFGRIHGSATNSQTGATEFDSDKAPAEGAEPAGGKGRGPSRGFTALAGKTGTVKVGRDGKIGDVAGFAAPTADGARDMAAARAVTAARSVKTCVQGCFIPLPDKPVAVGDTWTDEVRQEPVPGFRLAALLTYKVTAIDAETVAVSMEGKFAPDIGEVPPAGETGKDAPKEGAGPGGRGGGGGMLAALVKDSTLEKGDVRGTFTVSRKDGMVTLSDTSTTLVFKGKDGSAAAGSTLEQTQKSRVERKAAAEPTAAPAPATPPAPQTPPAPPAPK